ncbi:MAG: histidine kinase N-terminal 7TM domain-containing protein [Anaerolineales bacterium]
MGFTIPEFTYTPFIIPLFAAAAIALLIAVYMLPRRRAPGARELMVISGALALWAAGYALEIAAVDLATKHFWGQVQYVGIALIPYLWLMFVLAYTQQYYSWSWRKLRWLIIFPFITIGLVFTNSGHGLIWTTTYLKTNGALSVLGVIYGPWFWLHFVFSYALLLAGAVLLLRAVRQSQALYRPQIWAVIIAVLSPWLGNALYLTGLTPVPGLDLTPFAFTLTLSALAWGIFGYRLGDIAPIARDLVVEGLREGMMVLDLRQRIVDINPAAARMVGIPARQALGKTVADVLAPWPHLVARFKDVLEGQEEIIVGRGETQRRYRVRIAPLRDRQQRLLGRVISINEYDAYPGAFPATPLPAPPPPEPAPHPDAAAGAPPTEPPAPSRVPLLRRIVDFMLPAPQREVVTSLKTSPLVIQALERAFTSMLRFAALLGTLALLIIWPTALPGARVVFLAFGGGIVFLWGLALARQINFDYRVHSFILAFYALALLEVVYYGYSVEAFMYLLVLVALATLLRGPRNGLIMLGINVFTLATFGWQIGRGHYIPPSVVDTPIAPRTIEMGLTSLLIFVASGSVVLVTSSVLLGSITKAWEQEAQARNLLQAERDLLEARVIERTRDLAEARDRAEKSRDELRKYFLALEQSGNTIVITDKEGAIEYANPRFEALTGYTRAEVLGQNPRVLKSGEHDAAYYENLWATISAGRIWYGEFLNRRKDGTLFWETATIAPLVNLQGEITHYVAVKEDITERKESEVALRRYAEELEISNKELDAFAHTVAHDLKTPLTVIVGFGELLRSRYDALSPEFVRENLERVTDTAHKMVSIINELLLLSSIRQLEEVPRQPLQMAEVVREVEKRLATMLSEYEAEIQTPETWPTALGHAPWVEEVWVNYISNALKYGGTPPRVELGYTLPEAGNPLPASNRQQPPMIKFWVRDNGPGLTAAEQKRLFTQFTRLHEVRAEGHGLGLSIVERIISRLGGEVGVQSEPGAGSTFWFTLPAAGDEVEPPPDQLPPPARS